MAKGRLLWGMGRNGEMEEENKSAFMKRVLRICIGIFSIKYPELMVHMKFLFAI